MSEALLSDNQIDLIRSAIAKDKKQQLARTRESYRKLKKDRVKDILNNPSSINDEKAKQSHKEAVKHILSQNFEDSIVTASYDKKIIDLCHQQRKQNDVEVRLSLSMLYRQGEMEEKMNDQERIRSEKKSKQMGKSRKSLVVMQESRKEVVLMSPSPAEAKITSKNDESYFQSSAQVGENCHSYGCERQSFDRVQQSPSSNLDNNSVTFEQNEPNSQQDASVNNSIMNSPTFFPCNRSQQRLRENSSKQEKQLFNPQLSPPAIDSLEQQVKLNLPQPKIQEIFQNLQGLQEIKINSPEPKIQENFENLQVKTEVVPQIDFPEPIIENIQQQESVLSAACEQSVKVEQQIVELDPNDIAVQSSALESQNVEYLQHQQRECEQVTSSVLQPEVKTTRVEAAQFPLKAERITENISTPNLAEKFIQLNYEFMPETVEGLSALTQITSIKGYENSYELIQ